jgi:nitrate/nitrite transporter NarK
MQFWAQALSPLSVDVLFTVGLIIVSDSFPEKTQALAGAVFSTVGNFGQSLSIGLCQVVALGVMNRNGQGENDAGQGKAFNDVSDGAMLEGYRAGFWTMFASMILCGCLAVVGLRNAGKIGMKRE